MTNGDDLSAGDLAVIDRWWQAFVATGQLPAELEPVQGRLIRAVHRGHLPSGPVHVKTMTFPRHKDRLRYSCRSLPAAHEAAMLRATRAAGLPCPEVVAVRTARRALLPFRSMLVLRTLPVGEGSDDLEHRCLDEAALAARLLAAGIEHRDLHQENFVRCRDGQLAVLDLQSARHSRAGRRGQAAVRLAVAARLVRDRQSRDQAVALSCLREVGLLRDNHEEASVRARSERDRRRYQWSRVRRCLQDSTEFERQWHTWGVEYRLREGLGAGRWWHGPGSLSRAWLGQRARQLATGDPLLFRAFFRKWWWLGGGAALYVPATCADERIEAEVGAASASIRGHSVGERIAAGPRTTKRYGDGREEW